MHEGRLDDARESFERVIKKHPEDPEIYLNLAPVYSELKNFDKALKVVTTLQNLYDQGYFKNSKYKSGYMVSQFEIDNAFADVYRAARDYDSQIRYLKKTLGKAEGPLSDGVTRTNLAEAYMMQGNYKDAWIEATKAISLLEKSPSRTDINKESSQLKLMLKRLYKLQREIRKKKE
ncbi:MAG: tetratricopeptide repeat protein [Chloroflexi bacterium]|nr:tetratricopeptide repeat protein [Chloroflexota bacterium]